MGQNKGLTNLACRGGTPMRRFQTGQFLVFFTLMLLLASACGGQAARQRLTQSPPPSITTTPVATAPSPAVSVTPTVSPDPASVSPVPPADVENLLGLHATDALGEQKVSVIIADFPDVKPILSREQISDRVFRELDTYLRDVSFGRMWLAGDVMGRYTLPQKLAAYNISIHNLEADRSKVRALVTDALNLADRDVNFARYDHVMIVLGASSQQFTGVCYCAMPGMLGMTGKEKVVTKSGQAVTSAGVFSEDCYLGNFAHDTMHMLGGIIDSSRVVPCLYDQDLQALPGDFRGMQFPMIHLGFWDPMSCHVYKPEQPPTGLSAWTKLRLGWIEPAKIAIVNPGEIKTVRLDPLGAAASAILLLKIPLTDDTFYLVENRQKVGYDRYDPATGVLISYGDDGFKGECRHGQGPVQLMDANPGIPYLQGAAFDVGKKTIFKDPKYNLAIILKRKVDLSYEIKVTTAADPEAPSENAVFPSFPEGYQRTQ
jgi:M6 family metalloprotease-like protein